MRRTDGPPHEHEWINVGRDENADRIRTLDQCGLCQAKRYGFYAKRLGEYAVRLAGTPKLTREWWGPVGVWVHSIQRGAGKGGEG
jgi:hypothetical protein